MTEYIAGFISAMGIWAVVLMVSISPRFEKLNEKVEKYEAHECTVPEPCEPCEVVEVEPCDEFFMRHNDSGFFQWQVDGLMVTVEELP